MKRLNEFVLYATEHVRHFPPTMSEQMFAEYDGDPFIILISCLLSLRARDRVTIHVCRDLFAQARTPQDFCDLPLAKLEKIIFKTGFYHQKARSIQAVSRELIMHHRGFVPQTTEQLLALPGVGIKTANLVLSVAFGVPAICVDTHVHKLSNQLGLVTTKTPEETEKALRTILPQKLWSIWNRLLVLIGQNGCLTKRGCKIECRITQFFKNS